MTRSCKRGHRFCVAIVLLAALQPATADEVRKPAAAKLPYPYVYGKAFHVLPETHNQQSGYFSLSEGLDGSIHVGTAKYGENAYLVEFDPTTGKQRIVLDTNKVCGIGGARGMAAQAKLHTRNYVAPSGRVYVGSKQGYPQDGDTQAYPGGYAMVYDPRLGRSFNLGMPLKGEGVIDIVADEGRGILYVVTCEAQHWMRGDLRLDGPVGKGDGAPRVENYRELGPLLARYASTLLGADGCAYALTADFQLARYDPAADKVSVRPIEVGGKRFTNPGPDAIPTWITTADGKRAYLILMNDPHLLEIPLDGNGDVASAVNHGTMLEGKGSDSRCALTLHPDGRVYALVRVDNQTGFGQGYLHHLTRFDPATKKMEDLGVLAVENPDFFPLSLLAPGKQAPPHCNGYHMLPDGTWTPLHHHMALIAARDGTLYATVLAPFTLLKIDSFKRPAETRSAAGRFLDAALRACDRAEANLDELTKAAERIAERHLAGGRIGYPFENTQPLAIETWGRSGGLIHVGFDQPSAGERKATEKAQDVALVGYHAAPRSGDVDQLKQLGARGCYLVGLGPRGRPDLAEVVAACDTWIDTTVPGDAGGSAELVSVLLHGWCLTGETVAALTRRGAMPTMWQGFVYDGGRAWAGRYHGKKPFHDDLTVPPVKAGELGPSYLRQVRYALRRLKSDESKLVEAARLIREERGAGRKTVVAWSGHLGYGKPNPFDLPWARVIELETSVASMVEAYGKEAPEGALVLRLGSAGRDPNEMRLMSGMGQRVIHLSGEHPDPRWGARDVAVRIDLGYAFGDACVTVDGYPIRILPPSGVVQLAAFGAIGAEVEAAE